MTDTIRLHRTEPTQAQTNALSTIAFAVVHKEDSWSAVHTVLCCHHDWTLDNSQAFRKLIDLHVLAQWLDVDQAQALLTSHEKHPFLDAGRVRTLETDLHAWQDRWGPEFDTAVGLAEARKAGR